MHFADEACLLCKPDSEDGHRSHGMQFLSVLLSTISTHFIVCFRGYIYMCYQRTM
jgi:hypothetical protein